PERPDRVPPLDAALVVEVDRRRPRQLADVRARGKGAVVAGEDDAANRLVAVELAKLLDQLVHELVGKRVERFRPVEEDDGDRTVALDEDERHRRILPSAAGGGASPPPAVGSEGGEGEEK